MVITWYGNSCFKITSGELTIVIDPFDKEAGLRPPHFACDIVCVTHNHYDHNNVGALSGEPFVVNGPGEYEIKGVSIRGIESFHDEKEGSERGLNTIYIIEIEDIVLCHMGDFGQKELSEEQIKAINEVDILFIPVGGKYTIGGTRASNIVNQIEPRIAIPMHYKIPGLKADIEPVDRFLKEMGEGKLQAVEKLTIKKKTLPEQTEIVVMKI
jgi:L-ascorbate metabolism protein UlaG (beta-lactamase superfamily)